ncbi:MAG TPA: FAD binding domain-containing protein [Ktedonobacteraceae bacterium]|nr:FAD binding domain-containing protein [Ktedonobacteraceae bacterium]
MTMWQHYFQPTSLEEALELHAQHADQARLIAGGTDVLVELSRGVRPTTTLIDISRLHDLKYVREENGYILLGALATHNDVIASNACVTRALPLAQACWEVAAPQLRTRATVVGNLVTASPANDTITALMALGAELVLTHKNGERVVRIDDFYPDFRRTVLQPGELIREIRIPALLSNQRGLFLKLGLRRAQAISVIDIALVVTFSGETVSRASITLGSLAPTIVHAHTVETYLEGKALSEPVCREAGQLALRDASPIGDVRGSATYRQATLTGLVTHGLRRIANGQEAEGWMAQPILLETSYANEAAHEPYNGTISTRINGKPYRLHSEASHKTLLNALREDAGLTGTKEGCAEGECGACTVWLNGQAVMSCMVPAAQAHNASITTIEGLARGDELHPLQVAFIRCGAVQCGFCIPGMLMAGAKLLDEQPHPTLEQAQIALSGNICRCTGYRKILDAVLSAGGAS